MLKNYIITAFRSIYKRKFHSILNILGLSIGIAAAILVLFFVKDQMNYDKFHEKHDRLYRVSSFFNISGKEDYLALSPIPLAEALKFEFPAVESYCRFQPLGKRQYTLDDERVFWEENVLVADSTFFDLFTHKPIEGSQDGALDEPLEMVLTEKIANKYFGDESAIGKHLTSSNGFEYTVTAVIEDLPRTSHMKFDILVSYESLQEQYRNQVNDINNPGNFWYGAVYTYILIKENADANTIIDNFEPFYDKYMAEIGKQVNSFFRPIIIPIRDVHFRTEISYDWPHGDKSNITIFALIGLFILIIAAINYMNLSTAFSQKRAKEIGMRKVLGATRGLLVTQFMVEAIILTLISTILGILLATLSLGFYNNVTGWEITISELYQPNFLLTIIGISLLTGLLSGSYPAIYLSNFDPIKILKGETSGGKGAGITRKILVVFQFAISVFMIIGTLIVSNQLSYINNKPLGFRKDNLVYITARDSTSFANLGTYKQELLRNPKVEDVVLTGGIPVGNTGRLIHKIENEEGFVETAVNFMYNDQKWIDFMDIKIVEGRDFDTTLATDLTGTILINETAAREFGWGDSAIGKRVQRGLSADQPGFVDVEVIGIVKDFHYKGLHDKIEPILLFPAGFNQVAVMNIRFANNNFADNIAFAEEEWNKISPNIKFTYDSLDEIMATMYEDDIRSAKIFSGFAFVSILIACLGLFGLASFMANQKVKEIGIRKVLGSSVEAIVFLFSKQFVKWVIIGNVIAIPLAYYALDKWLENFAYRTTIGWWTFALAALISLVIALLTISYQAIRAGNMDPVKALKYE